MSLADVLDRLDKLPEQLVMRAINRIYDRGGRGLFNSKFIKYEQLRELGYSGFRSLLQNICELDDEFMKKNLGELKLLADLTERLLTHPETETDSEPEPAVPANLLVQGEHNGNGRLEDWGRDPYA